MKPHRVLVVEDEDDLRFLLCEKLTESGYEVSQAVNGEDGFALARREHPDLILSDVLMPKKDGNQMLKDLRAAEDTQKIPVIIVSARGKMRDYFEVIDVEGFIEKPFEMAEVLAKVKAVLAGRSAKDAAPRPSPVKGEKDSGVVISAEAEAVLSREQLDVAAPDPKQKGPGLPPERRVLQKPRIDAAESKKKVIVLEPNAVAYQALARALERRDIAVEQVVSLPECLDEGVRVAPQAILLRNIVGEFNAEEAAHKIKHQSRLKDIPLIIYSLLGEQNQVPGDGPEQSGLKFCWSEEGREVLKRLWQVLSVRGSGS